MAFEKVGGDVLTLKEAGEKLTGWLIGTLTNQGQDGTSTIVTIEKEDGSKVQMWSSKVLDDKLSKVREGDFICVEYLGLKKGEKNGGREYRNWELYVDSEKRRNMTSMPETASATTTQEPVTPEPNDAPPFMQG